MPKNVVKVAVCGLGERIGHVIKFLAAADPRYEFVSYVDEQPRGAAYLEKHNIRFKTKHEALPDMLEQEELDLLMVGSPNDMHFQHIQMGLEAGLKVFTEKPVVTTEEETFKLIELLNIYGSNSVIVGLVLRYSPLFRDLLDLQSSGLIGPISSIEASEHLAPAHGAFFMRDWRRHEKRTGGYLLEKCCHDLDLYQCIIGSFPKRIGSFGGRKTFLPEHAHLTSENVYRTWQGGWGSSDASAFTSDADIVDHQSALIEYNNGVVLNFHSNIHAPHKARHFTIFGLNGMAEGDFERNFLQLHSARTSELEFNKTFTCGGSGDSHYGAEDNMAIDFSRFFFDDTPLPVSVLDALVAGLTAIKADESRKSGKIIDMSQTWNRFLKAIPAEEQTRYATYWPTR